jgi:hypothetical protein
VNGSISLTNFVPAGVPSDFQIDWPRTDGCRAAKYAVPPAFVIAYGNSYGTSVSGSPIVPSGVPSDRDSSGRPAWMNARSPTAARRNRGSPPKPKIEPQLPGQMSIGFVPAAVPSDLHGSSP